MLIPSRRPLFVRPNGRAFRILAVCTGNTCRSPQAEQLLRLRIPSAFGRAEIEALAVSSAGTHAVAGEPMDRHAAEEAALLGVTDTDAHVARKLERFHLQQADLVLSMEREHSDAAIARRPSVASRTFTLVGFTMLVEALASGETGLRVEPLGDRGFAAFMRGVVRAAHEAREIVPPPLPDVLLDILDPYRYGADEYRRSAATIDRNVARLAIALADLARGQAMTGDRAVDLRVTARTA